MGGTSKKRLTNNPKHSRTRERFSCTLTAKTITRAMLARMVRMKNRQRLRVCSVCNAFYAERDCKFHAGAYECPKCGSAMSEREVVVCATCSASYDPTDTLDPVQARKVCVGCGSRRVRVTYAPTQSQERITRRLRKKWRA